MTSYYNSTLLLYRLITVLLKSKSIENEMYFYVLRVTCGYNECDEIWSMFWLSLIVRLDNMSRLIDNEYKSSSSSTIVCHKLYWPSDHSLLL